MSEGSQRSSATAREAVREAARANALDAYLAALLAPSPVRRDLVTLAAYAGELARISLIAGDAMLAEIRLQWWREAIEAGFEGARTGSPIADEIAQVIARHDLPRALLLAPLAGRAREIGDDGIADEGAFGDYLAETEGAAFRLAARVLGDPGTAATDRLCALAGEALGRVRVALSLPLHLAKGRLPLPLTRISGCDPRALSRSDAQSAVRSQIERLAREARLALLEARALPGVAEKGAFNAFLPLALVEPYLRVLESPRHDPLLDLAEISPLSRVSRLWMARWRGRF